MTKRIHTSRTASRRHRRLGITLIEMMVALAITTFVVLVVNQLFNSVTQTVARGTQASELLQKSRTVDEQLAYETELNVNGNPTKSVSWQSRMVGPEGRKGVEPRGFLAIVQRVVQAPLTFEDGIRGETRFIRSDQLMFVYDQNSDLDAGNKRLPALAPSSQYSFTGDQRDSENAEYVRMWYGHVLQLRDTDDPTDLSNSDYQELELGNTTGPNNPNILAQDWVLGRHALFLTNSNNNPGPPYFPYGPYVGSDAIHPLASMQVTGPPNSPLLASGLCDVADITLDELINGNSANPMSVGLDELPSMQVCQNRLLAMMFTQRPLVTASKPRDYKDGGHMNAWDYSPSHTYFMGGVSDFIVEFAGDLTQGWFTGVPTAANTGADGELDRDLDGRIKWYAAPITGFTNWDSAGPDAAFNEDRPRTYPTPPSGTDPDEYPPLVSQTTANTYFGPRQNSATSVQAAFVWTHKPTAASLYSANFTQWPWMLRIRYRLHDRRGDFEGRQLTEDPNTWVKLTEPQTEPGVWYETILPVNYQNIPIIP